MKIKFIFGLIALILSIHAYADDVTLPDQPVDATTTKQNNTTEAATTQVQPSSVQNKQEGDKFLKKNKSAAGVVTLADGLQYKIIKSGKGPKPTDKDIIKVEYSGHFINGKEFDSSSKHEGAVLFSLDQVIPGWAEALKLMPAGSTWELYVPPHLAYGNENAPSIIGPNKTLIFKIKLLEVRKG